MKTFIQSITRAPGALFMFILMIGFTVNAGVSYLNETGTEGPNLLAAAALLFGQVVVIAVHQIKRAKRDTKAISS